MNKGVSFQAQARLNGTSVTKVMGNLLYHMATRYKGPQERGSVLLECICAEKVCTEQQLTGEWV
jgi:hypothetical protein